MTNPEFKGTVVPKSPEPIVDPVPTLYEQFLGPWAQAWVRPPLMLDGTEITSAEDLEEAEKLEKELKKKDKKKQVIQKKSLHCWQGSGCHATCLSMLINWLVNEYPATAGKVNIPHRKKDDKSPVDPLHVAYWLWQLGDSPDKTKFVSETDHPPYIPYVKSGGSWKMDHAAIAKSTKAITLSREGKAPEPLAFEKIVLTHPTVAQARARLKKRDELSADRKATQEEINAVDKEMETADKKDKGELKKKHAKLQAKLKTLDKQIAKTDVSDETDEGVVIESQRQKNKERLKRALLRGPVLMNMTVPGGHFILLYGYRDKTMYILDPGAKIPKSWFGLQTDLATAPGGKVRDDSRDILAIDAEAEFVGANPKKPKIGVRFIDNISLAESYYFESLAEANTFNSTKSPAILPFSRRDVGLKGGG
jgi:hypothetical protein